ncbi:MAG: endonuclease MutS2 [Clostridia bacterium]|nr:endonuclease MutS2 [Clostridia bacterium]
MSINEKTLITLEFDKVRSQLVTYCSTEGAKRKAASCVPLTDSCLIEKLQNETADARRFIDVKGLPSFGSGPDVTDAAARAGKGATLSTRELLDVATVLQAVRLVSDYGRENRTFESSLDVYFNALFPQDGLARSITRAIQAEDRISDDASPELADIRRKKRSVNNRIKEVLQHYVSGQVASTYLQENIVTTRNGRFVIPVKVEHKNDLRGLIHDTSSSGATVFMEPMAVVEANNELSMLESKERHEIERILSELSDQVGKNEGSIVADYRMLTELSYIFGRAMFGQSMSGVRPKINEDRTVCFKRARHPLIEKGRVVPIDLYLGQAFDYDTLVITGPNTGGKTVSLKTLGLLSLMAQAGLQIPADEGSSVTVFENVLCDIGDEQSIEQSLSTFSSHMVRIISILESMDEHSLVILDELGAGTDPVEGAALARAILEHVRSRGALCAVTTHYAELKAYALNTDHVKNASCEFDVKTLQPTYRLIIGTPGKSNAFAISAKLGIPETVIDRAQQLVDPDAVHFEDVIGRLDDMRQELEAQKEQARLIREDLERQEKDARRRIEEDTRKARQVLTDAQNKASAMVQSAKASSEFIFKEADKVRREQEAKAIAEKTAEAKKAIRDHLKNGPGNYEQFDALELEDGGAYVLPRPLVKGDRVIIRSIGQSGVLKEDPDAKGYCKIQAGSLSTKVHLDDLRLVEDKPAESSAKSKSEKAAVKKDLSSNMLHPELDLRGLTGYEAWLQVDKYLDTAILHGLHEVRLVHGKGTGALRSYLQTELRRDKRVESMRLGKLGEGDSGVTVITLKNT